MKRQSSLLVTTRVPSRTMLTEIITLTDLKGTRTTDIEVATRTRQVKETIHFRSVTTKLYAVSHWSGKKYRESVANVYRSGFSGWLK